MTFELDAIDRMYLNAYVPSLQTGAEFVYFLKTQLGVRVPSAVMVAPMRERFRGRLGAYLWIIRSTAMPNHYYVYILDRD